MELRFSLTLTPQKVALTGLGALLLIVGLLIVPSLLAASLDEKTAEQEIRKYLRRVAGLETLEELESTGRSRPTRSMAERWESDFEQIEEIDLEALQIGRFVFVPPFTTHRLFVVRAVVTAEGTEPQTRYFSLSARSRFYDLFWVNETSWWLWLFSV